MNSDTFDIPLFDDLDDMDIPSATEGFPSLDASPLDPFWTAGATGSQVGSQRFKARAPERQSTQLARQQSCKEGASNIDSGFHAGGLAFGPGMQDEQRRAALHSRDSEMTIIDSPRLPPRAKPDFTSTATGASPFSLRSLNFLEETAGLPKSKEAQLALSTAPADLHSSHNDGFPALPQISNAKLEHLMPLCKSGTDVNSSSGSLGTPPRTMSAILDGALPPPGDCRVALLAADARALSLPSVSTSGTLSGEDCAKPGAKRGLERSGVNPRKTEQNRRAQARFRQKRKDMFLDQQRTIQELTAKLEQVIREKKSYQQKTHLLQQVVEAKEKRIEALQSKTKEGCPEELVDACWELVNELRKGRKGLTHSREALAEMVAAMLGWGSPALAFIRREIVEQLAECLKHGGEQPETHANLWLVDLVNAYERMVHKWSESQPQAFRTFLALQLPEQNGRTADADFWRHVLAAGGIRPEQRRQLAGAREGLVAKMQQQVVRRREVARLVDANSQTGPLDHHPLLGNMSQTQHMLDLHQQTLKEEQGAVSNFISVVRYVLEPVQQAKLMVAAFPFPLDTLAICSLVSEDGGRRCGNLAVLSQLPSDSPFCALIPAEHQACV